MCVGKEIFLGEEQNNWRAGNQTRTIIVGVSSVEIILSNLTLSNVVCIGMMKITSFIAGYYSTPQKGNDR